MDDGFGAFVAGALVGGALVCLFSMAANDWTPFTRDARKACEAAGFHGGTYNQARGFVCFNYVSQRLP